MAPFQVLSSVLAEAEVESAVLTQAFTWLNSGSAAGVALGAAFVQSRLFRTIGLLWSLAVCAPTVPLIDWLLPARVVVRPWSSSRSLPVGLRCSHLPSSISYWSACISTCTSPR